MSRKTKICYLKQIHSTDHFAFVTPFFSTVFFVFLPFPVSLFCLSLYRNPIHAQLPTNTLFPSPFSPIPFFPVLAILPCHFFCRSLYLPHFSIARCFLPSLLLPLPCLSPPLFSVWFPPRTIATTLGAEYHYLPWLRKCRFFCSRALLVVILTNLFFRN